MKEEICECGHPKSSHQYYKSCKTYEECIKPLGCYCIMFRKREEKGEDMKRKIRENPDGTGKEIEIEEKKKERIKDELEKSRVFKE